MRENLVHLPRELEARNYAHSLLRLCFAHVPTVLGALTICSPWQVLLLVPTSIGISLLPPALAADSTLQRVQAVMGVARLVEAEAAARRAPHLSSLRQHGRR